MSKIFLLRHLETSNNAKGLISGKSESEVIAGKLSGIEDTYYLDKVYSSPSKRCR